MQTKKHLGQHWLSDVASLESICDSAEVSAGDSVLEIGPGLGTLTEILLSRGANVIALEIDNSLLENLQKKFTKYGDKFKLVSADILDYDLCQLPTNYKVVANIPYYLTNNLLRRLGTSANQPSKGALLMQKEVAERACAGPGDMSILSATVQYFFHTSLGAFVPRELFIPPPKIDSMVLEITARSEPLFEGVESEVFFKYIKAGFSEKRKKLRSSLSGGLNIQKSQIDLMLRQSGISPNKRAQELSLDDWYNIYQVFSKVS